MHEKYTCHSNHLNVMSGLIFVEVSEKLFEFVELWKSLGDAFEKVNIKHKTILHEFPIIRFYSNEPIPTLHSIVHERIDSLVCLCYWIQIIENK